MSQLYYNWFLMCYNNEPPTVTEAQLLTAVQRGMITEAEHQQILDSKQTEPTPEPTATEPTTNPEPTT
jgi:hypothetical protein